MEVKLARMDHRLLHGVVASQWVPCIGAMRVMVIDNETAADEMKKAAMKLAKPPGCALSIISLETALTNDRNHKYDGQTIFLITKHPQTILELQRAGILIPRLHIGGAQSNRGEAIIFTNRANATREELDQYLEIAKNGTKIAIRYIPSDKGLALESFLS